ncbi:MAG: hypothetical protein HOO90_06815 [Methylotenera sp.]|uniref:hypothetical protein n=1 Tax=Methylotenera sp. TaxID=2051956 RepID=UPI0017F92462|nr:hypothetical protein [Methylotenera sp.]NOU25230.1 hypothetical protein [Methylotenera sp.]
MHNEKIPASKELQDADVALRRAAQTAKRLAEQNGTPYVVAESKTTSQLQEHTTVENKQ